MNDKGENLLLAQLPRRERERLDPYLKWVEFEAGDLLIEPDEPIQNCVFPYNAVTSTLQELPDGTSLETGLMGIEGMVGIQLWLRVNSTPTRTIIQVAGQGHIMRAKDFIREVMDRPESKLNTFLARYVHAFLSMTSQVAACNRLHSVDQRLCRWLKLVHNRVRQDEFRMRQEFLAMMLGVQRPTLSTAAHTLAKAGLISYSRGQMRILDEAGLVDGSCECYELMETQMDRIFDESWRGLADEQDEKLELV